MDPWSFGSEGKGLPFSDEMEFPFDAFAISRKALMEWDTKPSYSFENDAENVEFMELDFTDMTETHFLETPIVGTCGGEVGSVSSTQVASPTCIFTPNSSFGESEIGLKISGSNIECNSHDSSLIDLKLGRLGDKQNSKERSCGASSLTTKRARTTTSYYPQTPFCQVRGCNMDLSSSKDYHRRHRVCVAHSKTPTVIVNGIEQRFCQQCSRFHLLAEFDDGKRSCRKRLAGHNERRRKPQLDSCSAESHKFLQSIQGARFLGDSFSKRAPFVFSGGILYPGKCGEANQCRHIKFDEESQAATFPHLHNSGKRYCSRIPLNTHTSSSNVQELCGSSSYSCALSLLSTQSQDLIFQGDDVVGQISGKVFYSSLPNPIGIDHIMLPSTTDFEVHKKGIFSNSKQRLSPQQGTTVDLLQLSSRLQRVEQRRSSVQVKHENEDFFGFLTT